MSSRRDEIANYRHTYKKKFRIELEELVCFLSRMQSEWLPPDSDIAQSCTIVVLTFKIRTFPYIVAFELDLLSSSDKLEDARLLNEKLEEGGFKRKESYKDQKSRILSIHSTFLGILGI